MQKHKTAPTPAALSGRFSFIRVLRPFLRVFCFNGTFYLFSRQAQIWPVYARLRRVYGAKLSSNEKTTCSGINPAGRNRLLRKHATRIAFSVLLAFCRTVCQPEQASDAKATSHVRDIIYIYFCKTVIIISLPVMDRLCFILLISPRL